jgi:aminoglycoside phosphotransferase
MNETLVKQYVATLPPSTFGLSKQSRPHITCTPLLGGLHHLNYKVTLADDGTDTSLVIRIAASDQFASTLKNEQWYIRQLGPDIAPDVIYFSDKTPFGPLLISRFSPGRHVALKTLTDKEIGLLAAKLHGVHDIHSDTFSVGDAELPDHKGTLREYAQLNVSANIHTPHAIVESVDHDRQLIYKARSLLDKQLAHPGPAWDSTTFSLCHGDIGIGNLLWTTDDVRLIDWDGANFGDPANEIAYIFAINNLDAQWQQTFLRAYFKNEPNEATLQRIPPYILRNRLFDTVWAIGKIYEAIHGTSLIKTSLEECRTMYEERRRNLDAYLKTIV